MGEKLGREQNRFLFFKPSILYLEISDGSHYLEILHGSHYLEILHGSHYLEILHGSHLLLMEYDTVQISLCSFEP